MTDRPELGGEADQERAPEILSRRGFFRGATSLAVSGLGAVAVLKGLSSEAVDAAPAVFQSPSGQPLPANPERLKAATQRALRFAPSPPAPWVKPTPGVDYNVVIIGGSQTGLGIANGFRLRGVDRVEIFDQSPEGYAGIWRTTARNTQLRTPKTFTGPIFGNPGFGFRAWYENLYGAEAFDRLGQIPRLIWADYLDWYRQTTETAIRYDTRLLGVEPFEHGLRLQIETKGAKRTVTTRKLVLATGYAGSGGPNVPGFLRQLPQQAWSHTASPIDFDRLRGKIVGVIGAGDSAFDAAATALEKGAGEVHLYNRRSYVAYSTSTDLPAVSTEERGHPAPVEHYYDLPEVVRWRNHLRQVRQPSSVPINSVRRAVAFDNFHIHLDSPWSAASLAGNGKVIAKIADRTEHLDYVIAGTGYRADLSARAELANVRDSFARWGDVYKPDPAEQNEGAGLYPYLGSGFQLLPRPGTNAEFVRNIHVYNPAARVSFGFPAGSIASADEMPRLVSAITRDLFAQDVDVAAHQRFISQPLAPPQDPAPYQKAVQRERPVAA